MHVPRTFSPPKLLFHAPPPLPSDTLHPSILYLRITQPSVPHSGIIDKHTRRPRISSLARLFAAMKVRAAKVEAVDMGGDNTADEQNAGD